MFGGSTVMIVKKPPEPLMSQRTGGFFTIRRYNGVQVK
jgi:hypothetical protein